MNTPEFRNFQRLQMVGCLALAAVVALLCVMPVLFVEAMTSAIDKLHLPPAVAGMALVGIFLGSFFNVPVYRVTRDEEQPFEMRPVMGVWTLSPRFEAGNFTTIAVNVGGCIVPSALAAWQTWFVADVGGWPLSALAIVATANIAACYRLARPIRGLGIGMPWFVSPLLSVGLTWLLLGGGEEFAQLRAPVAFVAGPLVGADLLHLKDVTRIQTGMLAIGGAGTFDGIVLSSILAALLA